MNINNRNDTPVVCDCCGHLVYNTYNFSLTIDKDSKEAAEIEFARIAELYGMEINICWFCYFEHLGIKPISLRRDK